jgi:hypothetical protein
MTEDTNEVNGKRISNSQITLKIAGSHHDGIYIEISSVLTSEIILRVDIQADYTEIEFESACLTWSTEVATNQNNQKQNRGF